MTADTEAGRALLDLLFDPVSYYGEEAVGKAIAAIEREAAQQEADRCVARGHLTALDLQEMKEQAAQQERERLATEAFRLARFEFKSGPVISDVVWFNDVLAILAEPSE